MWFRRKKEPEAECRVELADWHSDWQVHGQKRFRQCSIYFSSPRAPSTMTVIVQANLASTKLEEVEAFFEASVDMGRFEFRSDFDSDPPGVMLRAVKVGDLRVDVDLYYPDSSPFKGYVGMGADQH